MWMRIKEFQKTYGIPGVLVQRMIWSEWVNLFAQKITPEKENSPWIINAPVALKLIQEGRFRR